MRQRRDTSEAGLIRALLTKLVVLTSAGLDKSDSLLTLSCPHPSFKSIIQTV